jgi:sugar lactone lactonase YvrE
MKRIRSLTLIVFSIIITFGSSTAVFTAAVESSSNVSSTVWVDVDTLAGSGQFGEENGSVSTSSFRSPQGLVLLEDGTLLISDSVNNVIRKVENGQVSTYAGTTLVRNELDLPEGTLYDGKVEHAMFNNPQGLAIAPNGDIILADRKNHSIRKIAASQVTTLAGNGVLGSNNGKGTNARFYAPTDVAVAPDGTVYVADSLNHVIRKITVDGTVSTLNAQSERIVEVTPGVIATGGEYKDGPLAEAKFNEPTSLAIDKKGNLYVSDTGNQRIRYIDFEESKVTTVAGNTSVSYPDNEIYAIGGFKDGAAGQAAFNYPKGITLSPEGGLLIADSLNHAVRYLYEGQVTTLIGQPGSPGDSNGKSAQLNLPYDVAINEEGNKVWVVDMSNNKVRVASLKSSLPRYFSDVSVEYWAREEIHFLYENMIIKGYEDGTFKPTNTVTRAQAAIMLSRALDLNAEKVENPNFEDVREDFYAYDEIASVYAEGIMLGNDGKFKPNTPLTRGQMAVILTRAFDLLNKPQTNVISEGAFTDVNSEHPFYESIYALANHNISTGFEDGTFRPSESTTRAQFSVFLARALDEMFKQ